MNELGDILKSHDDALSASLRRAPEFDSRAARKSVRGRRTARTALTATASVAAAAALVTGGWWVYSGQQDPAVPVVSPSATHATQSETPNPSPTASATGRDAIAGPCPSRATEMSLDEATIVAGEPLTDETWLPAPVAIDAPAAAASTWDESAEWYEVGARDGKTILAEYSFMSGVNLVEEATDGSLTWISNPFPADADGLTQWTLEGVNVDAAQCYETLALPTSVPLVDEAITSIASAASYVESTSRADAEKRVRTVGGSTLYRVTQSPAAQDTEGAFSTPPFALVDFKIKTPFGGWLVLDFNPLAGAADVLLGAPSFTDYLDASCGDDVGFEALMPATAEGDWTVIGKLNYRDLAIATDQNPYAAERYAAYVGKVTNDTLATDPPLEFAAFLKKYGVVALRADEGGWWVQLNAELSPRAWC